VPRAPSFQQIVDRFGGHPAHDLDLDLDTTDGRAGWLVAAALSSERADPAKAGAAYHALAADGLARPAPLAGCSPERVALVLDAAGRRRPDETAALLVRMGRSLLEHHEGSLERLAAEVWDLAELGNALLRLAPGFGRAAVLHFLRPLRSGWPAAREVPLDPAALAAAQHLGWIPQGADEEGEPAFLARALTAQPGAPALRDVEAALGHLGRAACRRQRPERCPLGAECPQRRAAPSPLASRPASE